MKSPSLLGKAKKALYYIQDEAKNINKSEGKFCAASLTHKESIQQLKVWHLRLGHLPFSKIQHLFPSLNGIDISKECFCTVCPMAKQTRNMFSRSSIKTTDIFQLVHVDIWGPLRHPSRIKCNLFITFVDDYSRFTWVKFIKNKSDFLQIFKQFYEFVLTQFEKKNKDNKNR